MKAEPATSDTVSALHIYAFLESPSDPFMVLVTMHHSHSGSPLGQFSIIQQYKDPKSKLIRLENNQLEWF